MVTGVSLFVKFTSNFWVKFKGSDGESFINLLRTDKDYNYFCRINVWLMIFEGVVANLTYFYFLTSVIDYVDIWYMNFWYDYVGMIYE